jgi:hypothetical protein
MSITQSILRTTLICEDINYIEQNEQPTICGLQCPTFENIIQVLYKNPSNFCNMGYICRERVNFFIMM